jgi:hypothetical protein
VEKHESFSAKSAGNKSVTLDECLELHTAKEKIEW